MVHACNPSSTETQAGRSEFRGQIGPQTGMILSQKTVLKLYHQRSMETEGKEGDQRLKRWLTSFQMAMACRLSYSLHARLRLDYLFG